MATRTEAGRRYRKFKAGDLVRYAYLSRKYHGILVLNKNEWNEDSFGLLRNNLNCDEIKFFSKPRIGMIIEENPKQRKKTTWMVNGDNMYYRVLVNTNLYWIHHSHLTLAG